MFDPPNFLIDLLGKQTADVAVRIIWALLFLLGVLIVRRLADAILHFMMRWTKRTDTDLDDKLIAAFIPPVKLVITIAGFWFAIRIIEVGSFWQRFVDQVASTVLAIAIFWGISRFLDVVIGTIPSSRLGKTKVVNNAMMAAARQIMRAIVVMFAFVVVMDQWGYNFAGLLAGLGLGGLAIALAAQDTLSNLIGYFALITDSPFDVGDYVVTEHAEGVVEGLGFRSTRIRKLDQSLSYVPNSVMARASITNWSRLNKRRLNVSVSMSENISSGQVLYAVDAIRVMLLNHARVIKGTEVVQFVEIADDFHRPKIMIIAMLDVAEWSRFQAIKEDIMLRVYDILQYYNAQSKYPTYTSLKDSGHLDVLRQQQAGVQLLQSDPEMIIPQNAANEPGKAG